MVKKTSILLGEVWVNEGEVIDVFFSKLSPELSSCNFERKTFCFFVSQYQNVTGNALLLKNQQSN